MFSAWVWRCTRKRFERTTGRKLSVTAMTTITKPSGSPFHLQNKSDFCGAAVALMMLSDSDVGRDPKDLPEVDLFNEATAVSQDGFKVSDNGLVAALNKFKLPQSAAFEPRRALSEKAGTALVVAYLCDASAGLGAVSPASLIYGSQHWVAVESVWTDVDPSVRPRIPYKLLMLSVHDPAVTDEVDIEHKVDDDCSLRGVPGRYIFYPHGWRDRFDGATVGSTVSFFVVGRSGVLEDIPEPGEVTLPSLSELGIQVGPNGLIELPDLVKLWDATLTAYGGLPAGSLASTALAG